MAADATRADGHTCVARKLKLEGGGEGYTEVVDVSNEKDAVVETASAYGEFSSWTRRGTRWVVNNNS